jgi:hypothetical protein
MAPVVVWTFRNMENNLKDLWRLVFQAKLAQDFLAYSTMKMEALISSQMSVIFTNQHGVRLQKNFISINIAMRA